MRTDTDSDEDGRDDASETEEQWDLGDDNAYWRRRFFILCGGVAVVAVCAWLLPVAHPTAPRQSAPASRAAMAALAKSQALPPAAYGGTWVSSVPTAPTRPTGPTAPATLAVRPSTPATAKPGPAARPHRQQGQRRKVSTAYLPSAGVRPSAHPRVSTGSQPKHAKAKACAPAGIVLSLFTSQSSYAPSARPEFSVYAVSTATAACTLRYGPGTVRVVVTRHGRVVWDSAACTIPGSPTVRFTLGVPQVFSVTWNRAAKKPAGCGGALAAGTLGTLDAVALGPAGESSSVRGFTLVKLVIRGRPLSALP